MKIRSQVSTAKYAFAIGDIHGHHDKLVGLIGHCETFARDRGDATPTFVLLGDVIDRGPRSRDVVEFIIANDHRLRWIRGNHEDLLLAAVDDEHALSVWLRNGGLATLQSYGVEHPRYLPDSHLDAIRALPLFLDDGIRLFVHAGIDPDNPEGRDPHLLTWTRRMPDPSQILPRFVVHGHTITASGTPELHPNQLNLDTGAGAGHQLFAAAFTGLTPAPVAFIAHAGEVTPLCRI